jgi:predicted flap endonuclease-1-like 5' DNA nuclease
MFQESPFSGVCAYAAGEVTLMLVGTLLLGLLLGYLIWGWTRRKLIEAEQQIASLTTANTNLGQELDALTSANNNQQQELDALNAAFRSQKQQLVSLSAANSDLKKLLDAFTVSEQESKSELAKLQSTVASHESLISTLYHQLNAEQSRTADLEGLLLEHHQSKRGTSESGSSAFEGPVTDVDPPSDTSDTASTSYSNDNLVIPEEPSPHSHLLAKASEIFGKEIILNDLKLVEGIGPKIAEVLKKSGITSWEKLSDTTRYILRVILDEAGSQFRGHNPKTWPRQAQMAANGEWMKLKAYQDILLGGK